MDGLRPSARAPKEGLLPPALRLDGLRVTFVEPPFRVPRDFIDYPLFMNLGLLHNAALVETLGAEVQVVDAIFSAETLPLVRGEGEDVLGMPVGALVDRVVATGPDLVVLHTSFFANPRFLQRTFLPELARALEAELPEVPRVVADMFLGGLNYFPYDPEPVAEALGAAAVLMGETDAILPGILAQLARGEPLAASRLRADQQSGLFPRTLDAFPDPAFHLLPMDRYFAILAEAQRANLVPEYHAGERILPYMSSRGCPYACIFCTQQVLDLSWRGYSAERLCASLDTLRARYDLQRVLFLDDLMNLDGARFRRFAAYMAQIGLAWDTVNGFRADRLDPEVLAHMQAAGNRKVTVSAESADPEVLERIVRKGLKIGHIDAVARAAGELGYPCQIHYVIGFPGETRAQQNTTLLHGVAMRRDHGAVPLAQYATPVEGTRLWRTVERESLWADPEGPERDVSALFYRDSVIRDADFTPKTLRLMRESFDHTLRALDRSPTPLSLFEDGLPRSPAAIAEATAALPRGRRNLLFTGGEPLLHPELPALLEAVRGAGGRVVALQTAGLPLARPVVRSFVDGARIRRILVDLGAWLREASPLPALRDPRARRAALHGLRVLQQRGIRVSALLDLHALLAIPDLDPLVALLRRLAPSTLEVRVAPDRPVGDAEALLARSGVLNTRTGRTVRVHGLPPCLLPEAELASAHPWAQEGPVRLVPAADGTGLSASPRPRIEACARCLWRVGCPGMPG